MPPTVPPGGSPLATPECGGWEELLVWKGGKGTEGERRRGGECSAIIPKLLILREGEGAMIGLKGVEFF